MPLPAVAGADLSADGPSYEVMYLLDADDAAIARAQRAARRARRLARRGRRRRALERPRPRRRRRCRDRGRHRGGPAAPRPRHALRRAGRRRSACAAPRRRRAGSSRWPPATAWPALFDEAGALVVAGGPGVGARPARSSRPSARRAADEVVVLPNDPDSVAVAEAAGQAARDEGIRAAVIPTRAQVQGLAAIAVHEPGRSFDDDVVHDDVGRRPRAARRGHVAARDAMTMAGPCRVGDSLGVVEGDFAVVGVDLLDDRRRRRRPAAQRRRRDGHPRPRRRTSPSGLADGLQTYVERHHARCRRRRLRRRAAALPAAHRGRVMVVGSTPSCVGIVGAKTAKLLESALRPGDRRRPARLLPAPARRRGAADRLLRPPVGEHVTVLARTVKRAATTVPAEDRRRGERPAIRTEVVVTDGTRNCS